MSLSHLGQGKAIADLDTENSEAASACRTFYDVTVQEVLSSYNWAFATKFRELSLVAEDPTDEWSYSYRYPSDCLKFRRILSGIRTDTRDSRVPYKMAKDSAGRLIYTDKYQAECEYTENVTDPTFFPPNFVAAVSYLLAYKVSPRVAGSDPRRLGDAAYKNYVMCIATAQSQDRKEEQPDIEPDGEFVRARD